jgi:hypothetical protein
MFGLYRIESILGSGGQGVVYKARHTVLDREVALKVLHAHLAEIPDCCKALIQEGKICAQFDHPNLCRIYDYGVCEGTPYLALQYVGGATLSEFREKPKLVPGPKEAAEIVAQLAGALAAFHDRGLLHRDLKPHNVRVTDPPERKPVLLDFGLALRFNASNVCLPEREVSGTLLYMPPEQIRPGRVPLSVASDVYSLGVILYELLAGRKPFNAQDRAELTVQILNEVPQPPSWLRPQVSAELDAVCLKALSKKVRDRFVNMEEFAEALRRDCFKSSLPANWEPDLSHLSRPLLRREAIRFAFAGLGEIAPPAGGMQNRLFLDVGNALRAGVIDHHHLTGSAGSTASLLVNRLELIDAAVAPGGADEFTIVLHQKPDLDCVVSAYLAIAYLTTGTLPPDVGSLIRYVDRVDAGESSVSQARPFTLYAALMKLLTRPAARSPDERWAVAVREGQALLDYVLKRVRDHKEAVEDVDAFAAPGLFGPADRATVIEDLQRYEAKLADTRHTAPRVARMRLPAQTGEKVEVDALLVRDVQNLNDPARVRYFKDWARSDTRRAPGQRGFVALSVFQAEAPGEARRCILSVTPESRASLRGLGALLDAAETAARVRAHGRDNRKEDPVTGARPQPRPGYDNADPWYDGRAHGYTIVDSPRAGTVLTADEIEQIFLDYGEGKAVPLPPS